MPRREVIGKDAFVVGRNDASRIPRVLRFPLLVVMSLTLSSLLYSVTPRAMRSELSAVSRSLNSWAEVGGLVGVRLMELALCWALKFDGYDLAAISLLSHGPPLYLLSAFYNISPSTTLTSLAIDTLTTCIPFRVLRPLAPAHSASSSAKSLALPNHDLISDTSIQLLTTLLAAAIYSVTLYAAYASYLPTTLVTYFDALPSIAAAHSSTIVTLFPMAFALGIAAKSFIFTPSVAAANVPEKKRLEFDPVTATLSEHVKWNLTLGEYSPRVKMVVARTAALCALCGVNTFVQTAVTVNGVEPTGALVYAGVWVSAAALTGLGLGLVGAV